MALGYASTSCIAVGLLVILSLQSGCQGILSSWPAASSGIRHVATKFPSGGGGRRGRGAIVRDEAQQPGFTFLGGRVMTDPITVHFIWLGPWPESSKAVIRTAFQSLGPGDGDGTPLDPDLPTLNKWWELVRQYSDPSTNLPVSDNITVGEECAFDPGVGVMVTQDMVTETFRRALNASDGGPLNCSGPPSLPSSEESVYYLVVSRELGVDPDAVGGDLVCACSGKVPPPAAAAAQVPLKLVWSKHPGDDDYCNFWSQSATFRGAPNADSGLDTLVSIMLGELVEMATASQDGLGWRNTNDHLSINQMCPWPYGDDLEPNSQPVLSSDVAHNFSYNVVGRNNSRYMVQRLWSVDSGNCLLQQLSTDACTTTQVLNQAQGTIQIGLIVDDRFGLQPCRPNLSCGWLVSVDQAKFIRIWFKYLATTIQESLVVHTASCPTSIDGGTLMSGATSRLQRSRKLVDSANGSRESSSTPVVDRFAGGCATPFAGFLYDRYSVDATVPGSDMLLNYTTGDSVNPSSSGFVIQYEAVFCQGEEIVTSSTGTISDGSPEGQMYGKELRCSWVLMGKPDTPVQINFTRIDTVNGSDVVAIYKGTSISTISNDSLPVQTFSGNFTAPLPQITIDGPIVIVFNTEAGGGYGWQATFRISSPRDGDGGWSQLAKGVVAALVVGAAFLLALVTLLCYCNRKKLPLRSRGASYPSIGSEAQSLLKLKATVFSPAQLFKATEGFSQRNLVSRGRAGLLYRGKLADGSVVTIKRPPSTDLNSTTRELGILAGMAANENVANVLGYSSNPFGRMLVFQHMCRGSLRDALAAVRSGEASPSSPGESVVLSWKQRLRISTEIARGLQYLHMYADPCIIHRSFKSSNVLLDKSWVPHISGFHHAVVCHTGDHVELFATPNPRWAPDSSPMTQSSTRIKVSKADDIFGFGVILLEVLTGRQPLNLDSFNSGHTRSHLVAQAVPLIERGHTLTILDPRLAVPSNAEALLKLAEIAVWCLLPASRHRPTAVEVVKGLEQVMKMYLSPHRSIRLGRPRVNPAVRFYTTNEKL